MSKDNGNGPVPGPRISWPVIVSTATLALGIATGAWSLVRMQVEAVHDEVADLKQSAAQGREVIRRQAELISQQVEMLRTTKADSERINQIVSRLMSHDEINARFIALQKENDQLRERQDKIAQALDSTYNLLNEHLRGQHPHHR